MLISLPARTLPRLVPRSPSGRRLLAAMLRAASRALTYLARQLVAAEERRNPVLSGSVFEFHAEAGAPEGALYVDGQLVGHIAGVTRL